MASLEEVSGYPLDEEQCEELFRIQRLCVVCWTTKDGFPIGVNHRYLWARGKVWVTTSAQRHRVSALRKRPQSCVVISGDFVVEESALDALSGTEPIVHVSGSVRISRNDALSSIDALANIRFIGGDMIVAENPALPTAAVSSLLETIGEDAVQGEIVVDDT